MLAIIPVHISSFNFKLETSHLQLFSDFPDSLGKCCSSILKLASKASFLNFGNSFITVTHTHTLIQINEKHYCSMEESVISQHSSYF